MLRNGGWFSPWFFSIFFFVGRPGHGIRGIAMASRYTGADFIVWGTDQTAHGPLELPALIAWVEDERVTADTWVFALKRGAWQKAAQLPELHRLFESPASQ